MNKKYRDIQNRFNNAVGSIIGTLKNEAIFNLFLTWVCGSIKGFFFLVFIRRFSFSFSFLISVWNQHNSMSVGKARWPQPPERMSSRHIESENLTKSSIINPHQWQSKLCQILPTYYFHYSRDNSILIAHVIHSFHP